MIQILNADFENAPTFTAAQTADNWMDGTAAGSSSNSAFGWWVSPRATAIAVQFDATKSRSGSKSLKVSTTNTTGRARVFNCKASGGSITGTSANQPFLIPVNPSTALTLVAWAQTNNVATAGVFIEIVELNSSFTVGTSTGSNTVTGTVSTWTQLTATVTVSATTRYIAVDLQNATAGNVSDAWFDDIILTGPDGRFLGSFM